MFYQPPRALGLLVGAVLALWAVGVGLLLLNAGLSTDFGVRALLAFSGMTVAFALAGLFGYWIYALATLSYALDRNGLVIQWGGTRQVIPLGAIERLVPGTSLGVPRVHGISWWGYHVGRGELPQEEEALFYSTHQSPDQVLYVMTSERTYGISVEDPAAFAREVQLRQDLGPIVEVTHHVERAGVAAQALWQDRTAQLLAGGAVLLAFLVWAQLAVRYGNLPPTLDVHFPAAAAQDVVTVSSRDAIIEVPRAGTLLLAANLMAGSLLLGWDRAVGYLVFAAGGAIQVVMFIAVLIALA